MRLLVFFLVVRAYSQFTQGKEKFKSQCMGVEMFHKTLDQGMAGDQCGVMLKGVKKNQVMLMRLFRVAVITPPDTEGYGAH